MLQRFDKDEEREGIKISIAVEIVHQHLLLRESFLDGNFDDYLDKMCDDFDKSEYTNDAHEKVRRLMVIKTAVLEIMKKFADKQASINRKNYLKNKVNVSVLHSTDDVRDMLNQMDEEKRKHNDTV